MTDLTDYYESQIVNHSFNGAEMDPPPATLYIALHTGDPTETGEANEIDTASTNYQRATADPGTDFTVSESSAQNANDIGFGTADSTWGEVTHISIWDGDTDTDNALWYSALDNTKVIEAQDELRFAAGTITAQLD